MGQEPQIIYMPDRYATYRVTLANRLIGFMRIDKDSGYWIARTLGNDQDAADIRRFAFAKEATRWLAAAVNGVAVSSQRRKIAA